MDLIKRLGKTEIRNLLAVCCCENKKPSAFSNIVLCLSECYGFANDPAPAFCAMLWTNCLSCRVLKDC